MGPVCKSLAAVTSLDEGEFSDRSMALKEARDGLLLRMVKPYLPSR
jgi:hypothetical protein